MDPDQPNNWDGWSRLHGYFMDDDNQDDQNRSRQRARDEQPHEAPQQPRPPQPAFVPPERLEEPPIIPPPFLEEEIEDDNRMGEGGFLEDDDNDEFDPAVLDPFELGSFDTHDLYPLPPNADESRVQHVLEAVGNDTIRLSDRIRQLQDEIADPTTHPARLDEVFRMRDEFNHILEKTRDEYRTLLDRRDAILHAKYMGGDKGKGKDKGKKKE